MLNAEQKARIKWACRRGMLELDVMIMPFYEQCFDALSSQEQQDFIALLEYDDPQLFRWLMRQARAEQANINAIVDKIVDHASVLYR